MTKYKDIMDKAREEQDQLIKQLCQRPLFKDFIKQHYKTVIYPDGKRALEEDGQIVHTWEDTKTAPYLTAEETKLPIEMRLLQICLGLQTCQTKEEVLKLLREVYDMDR